MIYGNIGATSWSVREIPPAGYSNAMNIARRDKRRTNNDRDEKTRKEEGTSEENRGPRQRGRVTGGDARVKDTRNGFLVVYSVCKMPSQTCTHRVPFLHPIKDVYPCVRIIRYIEDPTASRIKSPFFSADNPVGPFRYALVRWLLRFESETFKNGSCY